MNYLVMNYYQSISISSLNEKAEIDTQALIKKIFPFLITSSTSRFIDLFNEKNSNDQKEKTCINNNNLMNPNTNNKNIDKINYRIDIERIQKGLDKRTSLMIKNLPLVFTKKNTEKFLLDLVKLNYIFIPTLGDTDKILGFSFINLCNFTDIIKLVDKIDIFNKLHFQNNYYINKKIEICYYKFQGLESLIKTFGDHCF